MSKDVIAPSAAQRTCLQCKASKKRCSKDIPCNRCLRLALDCSYLHNDREKPSHKESSSDQTDSRFDQVFQRLQRLEAQVFPSGSQNDPGYKKRDEEQITEENWAINPGHVTMAHMSLVLFGTLTSALKESQTSVAAVVRQYFKTTGKWLPMLWQAQFEEQAIKFRDLDTTSKFHLRILAMLLIGPGQVPGDDHHWYRACKYFFAQFTALETPAIEWIQAGMLIALFEHVQCVEDRAPTTLGICIRLAYDLGLDDVFAKQSSYNPGDLTPHAEEIILTWWGLQRLERYFNMPPIGRLRPLFLLPKQHDEDGINGRTHAGPPIANFTIVDSALISTAFLELEASQNLGQVQMLIRNHQSEPFSSIAQMSNSLLHKIEDYLSMLRMPFHSRGSWAGVAVTLEAALELQLFLINKQDTIDMSILRSTHSILSQLNDCFLHCRVLSGVTEDYLEGIQPTWFTIAYHTLIGYTTIRALDVESVLPPINLDIRLEHLATLSQRYRLPGRYLELLKASSTPPVSMPPLTSTA